MAAYLHEIAAKIHDLFTKTVEIAAKDRENQSLRLQLQQLNEKLVTTHLQGTNQERQQPKVMQKPQIKRSTEAEIEFRWRDGGKAPFKGPGNGLIVKRFSSYRILRYIHVFI